MAWAVTNSLRLLRAGFILARHGALLPLEQLAQLPWLARAALRLAQLGAPQAEASAALGQSNRISAAMAALGPSYIKLGQFLSTRPDVIGAKRAFELKVLQDKLPPFSMDEARAIVEAELGASVDTLFQSFSAPLAAASVAQVHQAVTRDGHRLAIKILRPGVDKRFASDIESFAFAARLMERVSRAGRRLRPVDSVRMLEQSMKLELDLRMEASALAEIAENTKDDPGFRVPKVYWALTSRRILATEWIDGTPMADVEALRARGLDMKAMADTIIQSFLRHAIRDGFFHADMHQGNLLVDQNGLLVALDFGITGRLLRKERVFLAEILHGFITRNYLRVAEVHFEAGYVPPTEDVHSFAQALRAIGEPILDLPADQISMARLLTQLFEVTEQFNMHTQPQLLLLQKTMVVVEGVARTLNPRLNMWVTAEPVVRAWIERYLGPIGKLEDLGSTLEAMLRLLMQAPDIAAAHERERAMAAEQALAARASHERQRQSLRNLAVLQVATLLLGLVATAVLVLKLV